MRRPVALFRIHTHVGDESGQGHLSRALLACTSRDDQAGKMPAVRSIVGRAWPDVDIAEPQILSSS